jgi:Family of unknown function (DUF6079)
MTATTVKDLFASDISRNIEEVIKVDQEDEQILREELAEYVATDSIRSHFRTILEHYWEIPKKPRDGIGVWVSGFFGSGKSSFAKYLGLALENREILGEHAGDLLASQIGDKAISVLLHNIGEQIPTHAVIFDISTDRGIRSGSQTITEIMYRLFLQSLRYAGDLDLSELEITLEEQGRLEEFKAKYKELFEKSWDAEKGKVAFAMQQASRVMHELESDTFTTVESWRESVKGRADITPGRLAERSLELMKRRRPGHSLVFVIDEVGQFVARDVQKMLDLQAVNQSLGRVGRGKMWLIVTSQEKLSELVGGLGSNRVELARLMDRFPQQLQVHLEPSDIAEVTGRRVLAKNAEAQRILRELFERNRGRLTDNTRIAAAIKLPELSTNAFVDLYPLLPYQIDLIINVVSGLRTAGGASRHVGGANRTIIKLAQQLLIHPDVNLAAAQIGELARIDQVYDLVSSNIPSELRGKIDAIKAQVDDPLAQPVAKAICLLQYVQSIHRTPENIASALQSSVEGESRLTKVKSALDALESALLVRRGEDGYRIPSPAEDDWEDIRASAKLKQADENRIHAGLVRAIWQPQPSHTLNGVKLFKAGLYLNGREVLDGDIDVHLSLVEQGEIEQSVADARRRSQIEAKSIFWVGAVSDTIYRETEELFRSREILNRKERGAQNKDEAKLVAEEKRREKRHEDELRRLLTQALLAGSVFFRGNDRSPGESSTDIGRATGQILEAALPEVFHRFGEAAAQLKRGDLETLMNHDNLLGLPPVFTQLRLVREESGKPVFETESGPLAEMLAMIKDRTDYGESATGKYLATEFANEPFGWEFEVVRLFAVTLLRAGMVQATSKTQVIDSANSPIAHNTFPNNSLFRATSFQPKVGADHEHVVEAADNFKDTFGKDVKEIELKVVAGEIRVEVEKREQSVREVHTVLVQNALPGDEVLGAAVDQMATIRLSSDGQVILAFNACCKELKEANKRASELAQTLTPDAIESLGRTRHVLQVLWPFLSVEPDLSEQERTDAHALEDILIRESFFRDLPEIEQRTRRLHDAYRSRLAYAVKARSEAYEQALITLSSTSGWEQLDPDQQANISALLAQRAKTAADEGASIPLLREETENCTQTLNRAITEMFEMLDGNRLARVAVASYFVGGIETEEQLDLALDGLRKEIAELIAAGKKIIVQ